MKRILFSAAIIAATTITATAQEVARVSDLNIVPSTLTYTGKPAPVGIDTEKKEFTIFDTEFNVVKRFNYSSETYKSRRYYEIATVKPSGAIVTWEDSWDFNNDPENNVATTLNEMIKLLSDNYGTNNWFVFTDYKGRTSCWSPDQTYCFEIECLGTSYPYNYFYIEDGHVKEIQVKYKLDFDQATIDNAEWTIDGDVSEEEYSNSPEDFDYNDYDANIAFDEIIRCTQTLFNDDDKWEYIVSKYGAMKKDVGDYWYSSSSENGCILRRNASESKPITGFDIKNEDGETVASFNEVTSYIDYVYKIGGNTYLSLYDDGYDVIYKYDPKSTDIKEVSRYEPQMANICINGRSIMVEADAKDVDEGELIDMGGRKMASSDRKGVGNLTINASSAADGVYSVALKKRGRLVGAQKIILK